MPPYSPLEFTAQAGQRDIDLKQKKEKNSAKQSAGSRQWFGTSLRSASALRHRYTMIFAIQGYIHIPVPSTTLHYITLHSTTLHYTTTTSAQLHSTTLHYINYTNTIYITPHYTTFHYTPLHHTTLHYTTLH